MLSLLLAITLFVGTILFEEVLLAATVMLGTKPCLGIDISWVDVMDVLEITAPLRSAVS